MVWLQGALNKAYDFAQHNLGKAAKRQKNRYDASCRAQKFQVGQFVWRWYPPSANQKLGKSWQGVYRIISLPSEVNCEIQLTPNSGSIIVHNDHLKAHYGKTPPAWQVGTSENDDYDADEEVEPASPIKPPNREDDSDGEQGDVIPLRRSGRTRRGPVRMDL